MIDGLQTTSTMDATTRNDTFNINDNFSPHVEKIAACAWFTNSRDHVESRILVLKEIFSLISSKSKNLNIWCILGDSFWQPDDRIIRYKKFFKRYKRIGVDLLHASNFIEQEVELEGKLKYFGAAKLSKQSIPSTVNSMIRAPYSYIIAVPQEFDIHALLSMGWDNRDLFDRGVLIKVVENNGLVLRAFGFFDDPESGYTGLAKPYLIKTLVQ